MLPDFYLSATCGSEWLTRSARHGCVTDEVCAVCSTFRGDQHTPALEEGVASESGLQSWMTVGAMSLWWTYLYTGSQCDE